MDGGQFCSSQALVSSRKLLVTFSLLLALPVQRKWVEGQFLGSGDSKSFLTPDLMRVLFAGVVS
jgi:hypothetical protein